MKRFTAVLAVFFSLIIVQNAYAYLDPGTGSYMIQILLGAFAAGFYVLKQYWQKIMTFFRGRKTENDDKNE